MFFIPGFFDFCLSTSNPGSRRPTCLLPAPPPSVFSFYSRRGGHAQRTAPQGAHTNEGQKEIRERGHMAAVKPSEVKVYSSRRQESHVQRRRVTGAGAGARGCGPHHPPVSRKSPARDESSFGCVVQTRQFLFVFSLRCVGFSRSSVLKFPFKGSW